MLRLNPAVTATGFVAAVALLLAGCAQPPMGPTVQVMPGPSKSFADFQGDDALCRGFASNQVAGQAQAANQSTAGTAALGTLGGAALGAAIGAAAGNAGKGAAIGAGTGLLGGGLLGASRASGAQASMQDQFNNAYAQCMFAHGNQVPGFAPPPGAMPAAVPGPALVQAVQSQLVRLGYLHGPADGVQGPATTNAIVAYQRNFGVPVDGQATPALLARLQATP